ncbi:Chaperone protein ClpB [bioreactor metagenome]|uniref:Chaperone protein ClpB n=2 Tax=root TaxID=1 RepID=A0A645ID68_9ZZZZ
MNEMKRRFKPEFLNRVDDIIMFKPLDKEGIKQIIDIFMKSLRNRLHDKNINIEVTESAKDIMVSEGYDPIYGARPLKRYISNTLETIIAKKIIAGEVYNGCTILIDGENDNIKVSVK